MRASSDRSRASGLSVLVGGETGYGEALNMIHMVRTFEDARASAPHIENQFLPKKFGHRNDKKLADAHDVAARSGRRGRGGGDCISSPAPMRGIAKR
jgi:methylisocitrate lyase